MSEMPFLQAAFLFYSISIICHAVFVFRNIPLAWRGAVITGMAAFSAHGAGILWRAGMIGHAPLSNLYESLVFLAWAIMLLNLALEKFWSGRQLGLLAKSFAAGILVFSFSLNKKLSPLPPALQSPWLFFHVSSNLMAYGAFTLSFLIHVFYLSPFKKNETFRKELEIWSHRLILIGFPLLTAGIFLGALWAHQAWGVYWNWDPKETWALITWIVYAAYLHLRLFKNWSGLKLAWIGVVGFLCVVTTYFGAGLLMTGLHVYAK